MICCQSLLLLLKQSGAYFPPIALCPLIEVGWVTENSTMLLFSPLLSLSLCLFYQDQYVIINYCAASADESKHGEYSGGVTHQTGAVRGGCQWQNTSPTSTLQPTIGTWEDGVLALHPAVQCSYYKTRQTGLSRHLVVRKNNEVIWHLILFFIVVI